MNNNKQKCPSACRSFSQLRPSSGKQNNVPLLRT